MATWPGGPSRWHSAAAANACSGAVSSPASERCSGAHQASGPSARTPCTRRRTTLGASSQAARASAGVQARRPSGVCSIDPASMASSTADVEPASRRAWSTVTYGSTARAAISSRRPGISLRSAALSSRCAAEWPNRQRMRQQVTPLELLRRQPSHGLDDREQVAAGAAAEAVRHPVRHRALDQVLDESADLVGGERFDVDCRRRDRPPVRRRSPPRPRRARRRTGPPAGAGSWPLPAMPGRGDRSRPGRRPRSPSRGPRS